MSYAIRIHETGGPDVLHCEEQTVGSPGPGEVRLRQTAIGLNYIDTYHRSGLYPLPLPTGIGLEAAGIIDAVGPAVTGFKPGDRVAYCGGPVGAYAEDRIFPAERLVLLPDDISDQQAAAMMLQGLTAHYLLRRTFRVHEGNTILVHAAAGGVGLLLCQWAKHLGATVIGTVSTEAKARLAKENGCTHPILYTREDFVERVREITGGMKVPVVYDSVGRDTFMRSLDCLQPMGLLVTFGQSSGPIPPLDTGILGAKGSLFLTRPSLFTYIAKREDLLHAAAELFSVVRSGAVHIAINQTYPLKHAAQAHRDLEARKTTGSTILTV